MKHRIIVGTMAATLACGVLAACASLGGTPNASVPAGSKETAAAKRPHWTQTSIGTFTDPYGVAVSPFCKASCDVYVADAGAKAVWKIAPDGSRTKIGDFIDSPKFDPQGVAVAKDGSVYVADKAPGATSRIWRVAPNGTTTAVSIRNLAFDHYFRGVALAYPQTHPYPYMHTWVVGVETSYVPATHNGTKVCTCTNIIAVFGNPYGVAGDAFGDAFIADAGSKNVYKMSALAGEDGLVALRKFVDPYGVAASLDGRDVYVADAGDKRVWQRDPDGSWRVVGVFADPYGVAVDGAGVLYVADPGSKNVWKLTP